MITAHRGTDLHTLGWPQEAALRMLQNNLDPEVAEHPEDLVVYGGSGKAARDWPSFHAIVRSLHTLRGDETLLVQSGKPVGIMQTHEWAPRVLARQLEPRGRLGELGRVPPPRAPRSHHVRPDDGWVVDLHRYAGHPAGHVRDLLGGGGEEVRRHPRRHDHPHRGPRRHGRRAAARGHHERRCRDLPRRRPVRIQRRLDHGYLDVRASSLEHALELAYEARDARKPLSIGVLANAAAAVPELLARGAEIDIVTDQTSAHDPLAYLPVGVDFDDWAAAREDPGFADRARESMARHVEAMVGFQRAGAEVFDYGNNIRTEARTAGYADAFAFPGFVPAYIRPLFAEGKGPFRWAALSGEAGDIAKTDRAVLDLFPENRSLQRWIPLAQKRVHFQGLPARICWLGYGERDAAGLKFNEMVASGELAAPLVIGRDHLDSGSVASPYRETEAMKDGSDAIADWPLLNALVNTSSGATWVSIHHGGGVGIGRSIHAGQVTVADGTPLAAEKLARVLTNDPGMGVIRHVDAGYDSAIQFAEEHRVRVPMRENPTAADA